MNKQVAAIAALVIAVTAGATSLQRATAIDSSKGYTGLCKGADALTGTTVVIDFQQLNGLNGKAAPDIVRCSPNRAGGARTGVQALQDAGISIAGTKRWGLASICRIEGRPSATERLPIAGNPSYEEACVNTPPASAYWSYWWANGAGTTWTYSASGALDRNVVPGGFEGWSFALNANPNNIPPPGHSPRNPAVKSSAPSVTLAISDTDHSIALGTSTSLTWTSKKATSVKAASVTPTTGGGTWSGALAASGTRMIKPTKKGTYTYKIVATGSGGSASATAVLTVT